MSWTKRQFVEQAFSEIGLASYVFDLSPEQLQNALYRLDSQMAQWNALGIRIGYPMVSTPEGSSLDTETNVPDSANEAIYLNLAIKIAPGFGKQVSGDTKIAAKMAYNTLLSIAAMPPEMQLNTSVPAGAGHKRLDDPFLNTPSDPLLAGQDSEIQFN